MNKLLKGIYEKICIFTDEFDKSCKGFSNGQRGPGGFQSSGSNLLVEELPWN